ncbi:hypothetical protein, partial [Gemmiger formicilis]|uniref:hypothetical protein n=1 Tax=Gemmiger formicilis TaxID=745368 RepID=UPI003AB6B2F6
MPGPAPFRKRPSMGHLRAGHARGEPAGKSYYELNFLGGYLHMKTDMTKGNPMKIILLFSIP